MTSSPLKKRQIASWLLLAVFLPMLIVSSLHLHEEITTVAQTECADCLHHGCHGHLTQTSSWVHDCVLCQFLTLPMLAAALVAISVFIHLCRKFHAQVLGCYLAASCGVIVTRGPPSV